MNSVTIVCAQDGRNIQTSLSDKLHGIDTQVLTLPTSTSILPDLSNGVLVLILTPQMCNDIYTESTDIATIIITSPTRSVLLSACADTDKARAVDVLSRGVASFSDVTMVDVANIRELHFAVAAIRTKLDAANSPEQTPLVNKYVLQPEQITQLDKELLIVLLEDRSNVRTVTVRADEAADVNIAARKVKNDVWMLPTNFIPIGKTNIRVFADDVDLGPASLVKESSIDTLSKLLPEVMRSCPLDLLSRTMDIDRDDVDSELGDILGDNHNLAFVKLLHGLLQFGYRRDPESRPYPTLLHFCACHGLDRLCDWLIKANKPDVGIFSTRNCDDMTPVELAKASGFNALAEKLQEEEDDNLFVRPDSPMIKRGSLTTSPFSQTSMSLSAGSLSGQSAVRQGASIARQARVSVDSGLLLSSENIGSSGDSIGSRGSGENRIPRRNRLPSDSATRGMTAILNEDLFTPGPKTTSIVSRPKEPLPMSPYLGNSESPVSPWTSPVRQHTYEDISDITNRDESAGLKSNSGANSPPWDGQPQSAIPSRRRSMLARQRSLPEFGSPPSTELSLSRRDTSTRL